MTALRHRALCRLPPPLGLLLAVLLVPSVGQAGDSPEHILAQTASLRGLAVSAPVPLTIIDSAELHQDLLHALDHEWPADEVEASRKLLVLLGLLNPDADLYTFLADAATAISLGYYDRQDKTLHLASQEALLQPQHKLILAHEFTHALQDWHFGLPSATAAAEFGGDQSMALTALIEGDANLAMASYARLLPREEVIHLLSEPEEASEEPSRDNLALAPAAILRKIVFPYDEGFLFALALWQRGGYTAINQAFLDPPRSTAQIIHPEKYLARQQPIEVMLPDLATVLGSGWSEVRSDVLGELDLQIVLEQFSEPDVAAKAAEGWAGDRFSLLESTSGEQALLVNTVWDSEAEAGEFFNTYADSIGRRHGGRAQRTQDLPSKIVWTTPNGSLLLLKAGPQVVIIMAPDQEAGNLLAGAIAR